MFSVQPRPILSLGALAVCFGATVATSEAQFGVEANAQAPVLTLTRSAPVVAQRIVLQLRSDDPLPAVSGRLSATLLVRPLGSQDLDAGTTGDGGVTGADAGAPSPDGGGADGGARTSLTVSLFRTQDGETGRKLMFTTDEPEAVFDGWFMDGLFASCEGTTLCSDDVTLRLEAAGLAENEPLEIDADIAVFALYASSDDEIPGDTLTISFPP
jgi:hypothetical protein